MPPKTIESYYNNDDVGPSPILMVPDKVAEVVDWYMLRLTPGGKYDLSVVKLFLERNFTDWVLAQEVSNKDKEHYHCCVTTPTGTTVKEVRNKVTTFLHRFWAKSERGRGWGNAQYQLQKSDSPDQAIMYTVKDGVFYFSENINTDYVYQLSKKSYKKYNKVDFMQELNDLYEQFKITDMSIRKFMVSFVQLKGKYRQPINIRQIEQIAISHEVHRNPWYANQIVDDYLNFSKR